MVGSNLNLVSYGSYPFYIPEAESLIRKKGATTTIYIWECECAQATADAAAEVIEDQDNELDGTTVAVDVYVETKHANDTAAGTGAREVSIFGIVSDDYSVQTVATVGVGESTTYAASLQRFIGAWVSSFGTAKDNEAEIEMQVTGGATLYQTIAAAANKTGTMTLWIAPGYKAKLLSLVCRNANAAGAGAGANTIVDNARIRLVQTNGSVNETHVIPATHYRGGSNLYGANPVQDLAPLFPDIYPLGGVDTEIVKVHVEIESADDGDAIALQFKAKWLLWKEPS